METISNLWNGRAGLAKTYWLWGVLSGIPWAVALSLVTPGSSIAMLAVLALLSYHVVVQVGIWRAASQYLGPKVWAVLAKIAVAITPVCVVVGVTISIIITATNQPPVQQQSVQQAVPSPPKQTANWSNFDRFNRPIGLSDAQWLERVKALREASQAGAIATIVTRAPRESDQYLWRWSTADASRIEQNQTWWRGAGDAVLLHVANHSSHEIDVIEFDYEPVNCAARTRTGTRPFSLYLQTSIKPKADALVEFLASDVITGKTGCLTIEGILGRTDNPAPGQTPSALPAPSAQEVHMQKIYAAHHDARAIFDSTEFQRWLARTPRFKNTPTQGTAQEIIDMFSAFKRRSKEEHQRLDREIDRRNDAAAEALSRSYELVYPQ